MKQVNVIYDIHNFDWPENAYRNYGILAYHVGVIHDMKIGDVVNLIGYHIERSSDNVFCGRHESEERNRHLGNVWGAAKWYTVNFVTNELM
jgi:hypothetical protein